MLKTRHKTLEKWTDTNCLLLRAENSVDMENIHTPLPENVKMRINKQNWGTQSNFAGPGWIPYWRDGDEDTTHHNPLWDLRPAHSLGLTHSATHQHPSSRYPQFNPEPLATVTTTSNPVKWKSHNVFIVVVFYWRVRYIVTWMLNKKKYVNRNNPLQNNFAWTILKLWVNFNN